MNFKSLILSTLAVAALAACTKENEVTPQNAEGDAWLAVKISMPQTRASGPGTENGTEAESTASSVVIVGFDDSENKLGVYTPTVNTTTVTQATTSAVKVSKSVTQILVIVNPDAAVTSALNSGYTFDAINQTITEDVSNITADNGFLMVSSGAAADDHGLTAVTVHETASAAESSPVSVNVDRAMSKVTLAAFAGTVLPTGASASVDGFLLSGTNTRYYIYSERVDYTIDTDTYSGQSPAVYRIDPNYDYNATAGSVTWSDQLNWLTNEEAISTGYTWNAAGVSVYCHENTMSADAELYGNTTNMIIKAQYAPSGITIGDNWFRLGGTVYTLAQLQELYPNDTTAKKYMDSFFTAMNTADDADITATDFSTLTDAELKLVPMGGYVASQAETTVGTETQKGVLEFFQASQCWYRVNIMHDYRVTAGGLGRWGVVRNNFYTININSITQPGTPYIPGPDGPDDPDTPDDDEGYIDVTIEVNPWTTWTQDVDL